MAETHLTHELLAAIARGKRNPSDLATVAMSHLFSLCPRCRREFDDWRAGLKPEEVERYGRLLEEMGEPGELEVLQPERQRLEAEPKLDELLRLGAEARLEWVRRAPERFQGPALAELLIDESDGRLAGDAEGSYALAHLAYTVLLHSSHSSLVAGLYARALARMANARKVQGRLREAEDLFGHARFALRSEGGGDLRLKAELDQYEGSLRRYQRRLGEAEELLRRAVTAHHLERHDTGAARALVSLGMVHREQGRLEEAIRVTQEALALIDAGREPRLFLMAWHNLANRLCDLDRHEEAAAVITEMRPLYQRFPEPSTQLRLAWVEARIARGRGEEVVAEGAFLAVRDGFLRQGSLYDAALVALELATLYFDQGRRAELGELAAGLVAVFESHEVHREAQLALLLFEEAVRSEQASLHLIGRISRYLEQSRRDPSYRFREAP
jgi:tetratricopeptide (TPR) repeat protein